MSDAHGPIWIVNAPTTPYPDERFDGVPYDEAFLHAMQELNRAQGIPPLNPNQPTPEQIADAARLAADDMATVMRHWTFSAISDLPNLRALLRLLIPHAPKWETMIEDLEAARQFVAAMENDEL